MTTNASDLQRELSNLSSAEDFFDYFAVPYDRAILNVSRLHILKRFNQYVARDGGFAAIPAPEAYARCREHLRRAYTDFLESSGIQEKIFRVFQRSQGITPIRFEPALKG